ncbi:MAG TPA: hypothetical protein VL025_14390 [Thermoanaerobaculia bacterium]|nr:hypothetical protein [Thermoanaerobaculia bacterium]
MKDPEQLSGVFFLLFFVLSIVIAVLGISVWWRLRDAAGLPVGRSPALVTVLALACVFVLSFLSIFMPLLALLPAAWFCIGGLWLVQYRGVLNRNGGIVVLLVGVHWIFLTAIQVALEAWQKTVSGAIRIDILVTLPLACLAAVLGWVLLDRLPVDPDWKPQRKPVSLLGGPHP